MIRLMIVDDHPVVREGLRGMIDGHEGITVVGEAGSGDEAVVRARDLTPDVVLMDLRMPRVDGLEATRRILAAHPSARVVVLTTFAEDENVYAALRAGATGFLVKDDPPDRMVEAVRRAAHGEQLLAPSVLRRVVAKALSAEEQRAPERPPFLTEREIQVLTLVGTGLSNQEIAARLHVGVTTVKTHVAALMEKLRLRNRTQVAVVAHRLGLVGPDFRPADM